MPRGVLRYTKLPPSLVAMLQGTVTSRPEHEALVELGGDRISYQQLWDRAARVAGGLRAAGVGRGDRVAIRLPNGNDWAFAFWGIQLAGAVAVPVNTRFTDAEVEYVVSDSGSRVVLEPGDRRSLTVTPSSWTTPRPPTWPPSSTRAAPPASPRAR